MIQILSALISSIPITLFTYNTDFQQTGSVVVNQDQEHHRFLVGLVDTDLISFDFPVTLISQDSTRILVNSNTDFVNAMQNAIDSCDEDDDNDYNDDDFTKESLDSLLITCPWSIRRLEAITVDNVNQTQEDILTFSQDGTVVSNNGIFPTQFGKWLVTVTDFNVFITLGFDDTLDLNGNRYTYEIGEGRIKMTSEEGDQIVLQQNCGFTDQVCGQPFIEEVLQNGCRWSIFEEQDTNIVEVITVEFINSEIVAYDANETIVDQGDWNIEGALITFSGLTGDLERFTGDWEVITCSEKRFSLRRGEETLALVENCDL